MLSGDLHINLWSGIKKLDVGLVLNIICFIISRRFTDYFYLKSTMLKQNIYSFLLDHSFILVYEIYSICSKKYMHGLLLKFTIVFS